MINTQPKHDLSFRNKCQQQNTKRQTPRCHIWIMPLSSNPPNSRVLPSFPRKMNINTKSQFQSSILQNTSTPKDSNSNNNPVCSNVTMLDPNPNYRSEVSETITDLANTLLSCRQWDTSKTKSPLQPKVPKLQQNKDPRPFTKALPTSVQIQISNMGQTDCYIDDLTTTTVEIGDNTEREAAATLLAIHMIGRPVDNRDPIKRLDLVSMSKLQVEAALEESKILLGWKLDTELYSSPSHSKNLKPGLTALTKY
jgi:hypothetical protein